MNRAQRLIETGHTSFEVANADPGTADTNLGLGTPVAAEDNPTKLFEDAEKRGFHKIPDEELQLYGHWRCDKLDAKIWGSAVIIELWKGDRNHDGWSPNLVVARIFDNYGNAAHAVGYTCMLRGSNVNITLSGKM